MTDTYFSGKALAKTADLAFIADQLQLTSERDKFIDAVKVVLEDWFTAGGDAYFYYDNNIGSLIGAPASFGSDGELNDHHFHYGYFIKAAALIGYFDRQWARDWQPAVELLIKEVSNWDAADSRFPLHRMFDHYVGHHYSSGHAAFGSGNNQESSSEAMNFNAALVLWGSLMKDDTVRDMGIYLHASESRAIEEYWFNVNGDTFPATNTAVVDTQFLL